MKNFYSYNLKDKNKKIQIYGWVKKIRKLGDITFIDLRSRGEIIQLVFTKQKLTNHSLKNEDILAIEGKIVERKNKNPLLTNGEIEVLVESFELLSTSSEQLPLIVDEQTDALENIRMQYRYLDIRRPNIYKLIYMRSKFKQIIYQYFYDLDFLEIETPMITKKTTGGSGELSVLSKNHPGKEYVLAQSPQLYKQLLMYGAIEKYFQIARCFRDEDSRSDRQLEFTQLDLEKSFTSQEEIWSLIEGLLQKLFKELLEINLSIPFKRLSYQEAYFNYGNDKPDLRIDNKIYDLTSIFKNTKIHFIEKLLEKKFQIKALFFKETIPKNVIKKMHEELKSYHAGNLVFNFFRVEDGKYLYGSLTELSTKEISAISKIFKQSSYTLFFIIDKEEIALEYLSMLRNRVARQLKLVNPKEFNFVWIVDWPLFLINKNGEIEPSHNPFTKIRNFPTEDFLKLKDNDKKLLEIKSYAYDLVLNGAEIGGGAIRINDSREQAKIFKILGLSKMEIEENFGWLLKAQNFSTPPHGGIALGIDRILAILFSQDSIREIIAFPKTSHGTDELTGAPTVIKNKN